MATEAKQTVHSGNTVLLSIDDKVIGRAQSLSSERSFGTTGVYEIGSIMPQEHIFLKYEGTVTLNRLRMRKEDLVSAGYSALGEDVLKIDVIDISLLDRTGSSTKVIETYSGCSIDSYNTEVRANEIASEEARFFYLTAQRSK